VLEMTHGIGLAASIALTAQDEHRRCRNE